MASRYSAAHALVGILTAVFLLAGCASSAGAHPRTTEQLQQTAPPSLSDDEALAVALSVYGQWSLLMDTITAVDAVQFRKMHTVATNEYVRVLASDGSFDEPDYFITGTRKILNPVLVDAERHNQSMTLQIALCHDVSDLVFIDHDGADVTDDVQITGFVAATAVLVWNADSSRFLIDQWSVWHDDSICDEPVRE